MQLEQQVDVLLVEDRHDLARLYFNFLKEENYRLTHVDTGQAALDILRRDAPDVVLLDLGLPDMNGLDILEAMQAEKIPTVAIVVSANSSIEDAVKAMHYHAMDFIEKPFTHERLIVTLRNAVKQQQLSRLVNFYKENERHEYNGFIGASLPMQAIYRIIDSVASSKATVFITGESGTGKEVCAEAIHKQSPRAEKPFIALNCAAIPRELMESEIFGHVRGSFTGAVSERQGAARQANGGTLFLDEIGDMDLELQSKLLRFVQTGNFQKVGGSRQEHVDVRFICATNRDPLHEVKAGRFREDLYYRLHVLPINLPPLRKRDTDIILIARHFLAKYTKDEDKQFKRFSSQVEEVFMRHAWPGNVRELQNVVHNMVVLNQGEAITVDMLPSDFKTLAAEETGNAVDLPAYPKNVVTPINRQTKSNPQENIIPLHEVEKQAIEHAISLCEGNVAKAAKYLQINASTIYRKMQHWEKQA